VIRVRGVPVHRLVGATLIYAKRRIIGSPHHLRSLLAEADGRPDPTPEERREALATEAALRRLGVRCLWRSAVVTEMLRRQGLASRIRISMHEDDPGRAHAEVEVAGIPLRPDRPGQVILR
jgi:hypothetical protein